MARSTPSTKALPPTVQFALQQLGQNLRTARLRRKQSLRTWSTKLMVSVPTLLRMERGDPNVSMGVYATALWLMNKSKNLHDIASPEQDYVALADNINTALKRGERGNQLESLETSYEPTI